READRSCRSTSAGVSHHPGHAGTMDSPGGAAYLSPELERWVESRNACSPGGTALVSHSYVNNLVHCVFSTKGRKPLITDALQKRLWPFLSSVALERGMKVVAVGGIEDHIHVLVAIP